MDLTDNFDFSLDIRSLISAYRDGTLTPTDVVKAIYARSHKCNSGVIWITMVPEGEALARTRALEQEALDSLPLYGLPFAVKDNIDVAGLPTTAGCPDYTYWPEVHAMVVQLLLDAGAILIGKTNLDQFATGLVGTRSPYGVCRNPFDPRYISGGSSSGSAVAVASGLVSFSLGTDTAGSGRIPASFNNIVGLKPSAGILSNVGIVPACRSIDCVSIFALTVQDAEIVFREMAGSSLLPTKIPCNFRFGVPTEIEFFGDNHNPELFNAAIKRLENLGGEAVAIDFSPFHHIAELLYDGPWIAERYAAIKEFYDTQESSLLTVTREIIGKGRDYSAVDVFRGHYRLDELRKQASIAWGNIDFMLLPSAPTIYTVDEVNADPINLNKNLGHYTNFVNLLNLCAISLPSGIRSDGLPFGCTMVAKAGQDGWLAALGKHFQQLTDLPLGATEYALPAQDESSRTTLPHGIHLAVVGAHLSGQPLNHQLVGCGARLLQTCRTAPCYHLFALHGTVPPKPGLQRVNDTGRAIEVEIWELSEAAFGSFVANIPSPLGIGTVLLESGDEVKGFLCEPYALVDAEDISAHGGWRAYLASQCQPLPFANKIS